MLINTDIIAEGLRRRAVKLREDAGFLTAKHKDTGAIILMPEAVQKLRAAEDLDDIAKQFEGAPE